MKFINIIQSYFSYLFLNNALSLTLLDIIYKQVSYLLIKNILTKYFLKIIVLIKKMSVSFIQFGVILIIILEIIISIVYGKFLYQYYKSEKYYPLK